MNVYIVFRDYGPYDGGMEIVSIWSSMDGAITERNRIIDDNPSPSTVTYRIQEWPVQGLT